MSTRRDGRTEGELRSIVIEPMVAHWAEGSALVRMGETQVWCTATVEERVPFHRRGTRGGWVTAEYSMLPRATEQRRGRERDGHLDGRSQEIQRLVARSLRSAVDLRILGERQVVVDCDVISADGGTRTASINGGFVALALAVRRLMDAGMVAKSPIKHEIAALAVGLVGGEAVVDLDYAEDSVASTDMNLVFATDGRLIEVQGTAEGEPFRVEELQAMLSLGGGAIESVFKAQRAALT